MPRAGESLLIRKRGDDNGYVNAWKSRRRRGRPRVDRAPRRRHCHHLRHGGLLPRQSQPADSWPARQHSYPV